MQPTLHLTADGSHTLYNEAVGEYYHSRHGAVQESKHVFIWAGLENFFEQNPTATHVSIFEVGFGTGLNFLLTADWCIMHSKTFTYKALEAFPLDFETIHSTGYQAFLADKSLWNNFINTYKTNVNLNISNAELEIIHDTLQGTNIEYKADVLYFDAFSAIHQPEMWTDESIAKACSFLKQNGIFVTYSITGQLKRCLKALGFGIEKLPGAPGKREMLRGIKL